METLTKENRKQILGNKSFIDDEVSLVAKVMYIKGINYFDEILNDKSQKEISAVIHIIKFPKGFEIKLAKLFKSYSIGIPYSEITGLLLLKGSNNKVKIITTSLPIEFSFKEAEYFNVSDFFTNELKLTTKIVTSEREFDSFIGEIKDTILPDKIESVDSGQKGKVWLIVVGYIFALLGGMVGYFIGSYLTIKIKQQDGLMKYKFDESTREQGAIIKVISIVLMFVYIFLGLVKK